MRTREYEPVAWSGARPGVSPKPRIFGVAWALLGVANFLEPPLAEVRRTPLRRGSQRAPSTHLVEWASLQCSKRRGLKKGVEYIIPANGAFIRGCLPVVCLT